MYHGQIVEVHAILKRKYRSDGFVFWEAESVQDEGQTGLFLGFRWIQNGRMVRGHYGEMNFEPDEYIKVCLISLDMKRNPVYVHPTDIHFI